MGRLFCAFLLSAVLLCPAAGTRGGCAQPVFFSMLFPQLIPECLRDAKMEEAVQL